jgi:hypothetical protein
VYDKKIKKLQTFAYIWGFIFITIALYPLLKSGEIKVWSVVVSITFISTANIRPLFLLGFYNLWTKIGDVIGGIISKIIMFILYFGLFTPISIVLKLLGKDLLDKKVEKSRNSYWIERKTQPQSMKNQF